MLCAYDYTNHNGVTAHTTGYFLDNNDVPPWDTWVAGVTGLPACDSSGNRDDCWPPTLSATLEGGKRNRDLLVSWIPQQFASVINQAIEAECIGMIVWADDLRPNNGTGPRWQDIVPDWLRNIKLVLSNTDDRPGKQWTS